MKRFGLFICLAVVSWLSGLAVVPAYCRDSLSASGLPAAQQAQTAMRVVPPRGQRTVALCDLRCLIASWQCCVGPRRRWTTPIWLVAGGHTMTSMQWYVTSALKASTSGTSPPHAAGLTGAGRDPESSAQKVSQYME